MQRKWTVLAVCAAPVFTIVFLLERDRKTHDKFCRVVFFAVFRTSCGGVGGKEPERGGTHHWDLDLIREWAIEIWYPC